MYRLLGQLFDNESEWIFDSVAVSKAPGRETSSNFVRKPCWYEMTLQDEQEGEKTPQSKGVCLTQVFSS